MLAYADIIALAFVAIVVIVAGVILFMPTRKGGATPGGGCFLALAFVALFVGAVWLIAFYWNR